MSAFLADFHFLRPLYLALLLPVALLIILLKRRVYSDSPWKNVCDQHLLRHLLSNQGIGRHPLLLTALSIGWIIAVLALAGPSWSKKAQPIFQLLDTRIIVLDLSRSMQSPDLKPLRALRARFKVADILAQSGDAQVGLVVFAGAAFVVSPITEDADTINNMLPALIPDIMPVPGSRPDLGLLKAYDLLQQAGVSQGSVILITDESNGAPAIAAATRLREAGFPVSVLGVGTEQGAPIPGKDGDLLKDAEGNIVIPALDQSSLQRLAQAGGGDYVNIRADNQDLDTLFTAAEHYLTAQTEKADQKAENWQEQGPWLVLLLLPMLALAFRRGWLVVLLIGLHTGLPAPAKAWSLNDLWLRRDQQFQQALDNDSPERAGELATTPWQRGTAAYREGNYEQAAGAFAELSGAVGHYNRGNALTQLERYEEAIAAYDSALKEQPGMAEALSNREIALELKKQQQQQQQQNNPEQNQPPQMDQQRDRQPSENQSQGGEGKQSDEQQPQSNSQQDDAGSEQGDPDPDQQNEDPSDQGEQQQEHQAKPEDSDEKADKETEQPDLTQGESDSLSEEERQVMEQWLRRIPDDPAGLLRNKFRLQYQRLSSKPDNNSGQTW